MQLSELIQRDVITCTNRDSLARAAQLMWEHDIGCLPITGDDGRVVGVLTDRDIAMAGYIQGAPLRSIAISSVMCREPVTCQETDDLRQLQRIMMDRQIRRVPVVDAQGLPVGIVTVNDIARAAAAGRLAAGELASTICAINRPRVSRAA
ncbi:MAG TPA: CBS domain-containing protein [Kofleriaceae bacterium]|nr:CBS domain-containing protein [Kofleriaceae bacterium]